MTAREVSRLWTETIGPFFSLDGVATLLNRAPAELTADNGLLALTTGNESVVYPAFQFTGDQPLPGLAEVLAVLGDTFTAWTVASWLVSPDVDLAGRTPVQVLRDGHAEDALRLARQIRTAEGTPRSENAKDHVSADDPDGGGAS